MVITLGLLLAAVTFLAGTASAGKENNPGMPFDQLEAKLDAIEAKLDAGSPIPADGTRVVDRSTDKIFLVVAEDVEYQRSCNFGPCTCFLDGVQASCSLVLACLDAGLCEPE